MKKIIFSFLVWPILFIASSYSTWAMTSKSEKNFTCLKIVKNNTQNQSKNNTDLPSKLLLNFSGNILQKIKVVTFPMPKTAKNVTLLASDLKKSIKPSPYLVKSTMMQYEVQDPSKLKLPSDNRILFSYIVKIFGEPLTIEDSLTLAYPVEGQIAGVLILDFGLNNNIKKIATYSCTVKLK